MTNKCLYPLSYPLLPRATPYYVRLLMRAPEPLICLALSPYKTLSAH